MIPDLTRILNLDVKRARRLLEDYGFDDPLDVVVEKLLQRVDELSRETVKLTAEIANAKLEAIRRSDVMHYSIEVLDESDPAAPVAPAETASSAPVAAPAAVAAAVPLPPDDGREFTVADKRAWFARAGVLGIVEGPTGCTLVTSGGSWDMREDYASVVAWKKGLGAHAPDHYPSNRHFDG